MSGGKICQDYSSQNVLFKLWKYGLILPIFDYNHSEEVFKYRKSYARFFNCVLLFSLYYVIIKSIKMDFDSWTHLIVSITYTFIVLANTCFSVYTIYSNIETIEKMSVNSRKIITLETTLGICGYIKRKRFDIRWLFYIGLLYILLFVCDISLSTMNLSMKISELLVINMFYILDLEFQQLLTCFKCSIVFHFEQLNHHLEKKYRPDYLKGYKSLLEESNIGANDLMAISSYLVCVKFLYASHTIIVCIFMDMELTAMEISLISMELIRLSSCLWFMIEISGIIFAIHQDVSIYEEVGFLFIFSNCHYQKTCNSSNENLRNLP